MNTRLRSPVTFLLIILALLPFTLGAILILSGAIHVQVFRWASYEATWTFFGLLFVFAAALQHCSPLVQIRALSKTDMISVAMVLLGLVFASIAFAPSQYWAMYFSIAAVVPLLVGFASVQVSKSSKKRYVLAVCQSLFIGITLHALTVYGLLLMEHGNTGLEWVNMAAPGFPNMRHYAFSAEAGICLGAGLFVYYDSHSHKISILIGMAVLWSLLFWTGARGAMVAIIVSFIITMLIVRKYHKPISLVMIASAVLGAMISLLNWLPNYQFGLLNSAKRTIDIQSVNQLTSSRVDMWTEATKLIVNNPLFGYGPGQFAFLTKHDAFRVNFHPHNTLLDILLSIGIVGGVFLIYLLLKLWFTAAANVRNTPNPLMVSAFFALNSLIAHSMLSGSLFFIHSRIIVALLIGVVVVRISQKQ